MKHLQPTWDGTQLRVSSTHDNDAPEDRYFPLPYSCEIAILDSGKWYAAAERYRIWASTQSWTEKTLADRTDIPQWWLDSPIVLSIKERGRSNHELGQRPSPWCHPLKKGIPRILELAGTFESTVKVQVFHWEKGGAFVNGDHFPPMSGFKGTKEFFGELHRKGHYGGVYVLPLKWCIHAHTTGYDGSEFFANKNAWENVCVDENGNPVRSRWDWKWRRRYHMCGGSKLPREEVVDAFRRFGELGADYIQFDTFNGRLYDCHSPNHQHPPGRGIWQNDLAVALLEEIKNAAAPFILTFEAEPMEAVLQLGHGFVERGFHPIRKLGVEMVPLYQFVYHEYTQGFAGENCGGFNSPENFYLICALSVVNGDMLMINLDDQGRLTMQTHQADEIDQAIETVYPREQIDAFVRDLNRLRRDLAKDLLVFGRMERPPAISCDTGLVLVHDPSDNPAARRPGRGEDDRAFRLKYAAVLGSTWTARDGTRATVLINYTTDQQEATCTLSYDPNGQIIMRDTAGGTTELTPEGRAVKLRLPPLSGAVLRQAGAGGDSSL